MSDRVKGFTVTLDNDYREEDIEEVGKAILQLKGVKAVNYNIVKSDDLINRMRIHREIKDKLYDFIREL